VADATKGNIEILNGSIGDLIFRIETLTSDRDTIKVCVRAAKELAAMTNHIARLEADARLADAAWTDNQAALRTQAAEIAALKRELNTCKHARVTVHSRLFAAETREEPADYEQSAQCQDCGKWLAIEDIPEDAEVSA
jgi:DNA repair exonuclease SbcCD ATPase subunit